MFITVARPGRAISGIVKHSKGKDGESVVAIPRFLRGSSPSVSIKKHVVLTPMTSFDLYWPHVGFL
jgi:hypothetical protein